MFVCECARRIRECVSIAYTRRGCSPRVEVVLAGATLEAEVDEGDTMVPLLFNDGATASAH